MPPRCWLPRRSWRLEHNQCHGPFNFPPTPSFRVCFRQFWFVSFFQNHLWVTVAKGYDVPCPPAFQRFAHKLRDSAGRLDGRRGRNRTCNRRIRNPMLYPFELRALARTGAILLHPALVTECEDAFSITYDNG